ncbi:MAG TPA: RNA polymerase subunit sigma-24, partial [Pirellulaceae bacterium]
SAEAGKNSQFDTLKPFLTATQESKGRDVAEQLGMSEGAVRVTIHRMKRRFGEILREEVGQTVENDADIDEELSHLLAALRP